MSHLDDAIALARRVGWGCFAAAVLLEVAACW